MNFKSIVKTYCPETRKGTNMFIHFSLLTLLPRQSGVVTHRSVEQAMERWNKPNTEQ